LGSSLRKVYGVSAQLGLVKVVLTEIGLIAGIAVWSAQVVGRTAVFEVVLLGCGQRSISRGHIPSHSLLVLKELGSCLVFVVLVLISREKRLLPIDISVLSAFARVGLRDVLAYMCIFPLLVDHLGASSTPANVADLVLNGRLLDEETFLACFLSVGVFNIVCKEMLSLFKVFHWGRTA